MVATPTQIWEEVAPSASRFLLPEHREVLEQSTVDPDIIESRGYYSLDKYQILDLVHREIIGITTLRSESWMGIPIFRPDGSKHGEVIRRFGGPPDDGMKYVWPTGLRLALDVHPDCLGDLLDVEIPIMITEGIKKADAILSAARREGIRLVVLAANGCDGWKAKVEGSSVASPDFLDLALEDRRVYVNSDSDYRTNNNVSRGWNGCATYVSSKTGEHRTFLVVTPPAGTDKQGADDYLAGGGLLRDLLGLAQSPERAILDTSGEKPRLRFKSGRRLIDDAGESIPHLYAPLIPERSITLFAGHSGTYKTWNMLGLALDGAFGFPWMAHPQLTPEFGPFTSLYVNKEMSGLILGQRLKALSRNSQYADRLDFEEVITNRLAFVDEPELDLNKEDQRKRLEDAIWESGAKLVILDSLSMCWHGDENSAAEVGDFYARLRGIIERTAATFTLLHHLLKPQGGKPSKRTEVSGFAIRGSGQLYQQADACLMTDLYHGSSQMHADDERLVSMHHVKARTSREMQAWVTRFSSNDGLFQSLSYLAPLTHTKAQASADTGMSPERTRDWILEVCRTMPAMAPTPSTPGFSGKQLFMMLQQSWTVEGVRPPSDSTLQRHLNELLNQGQLELLGNKRVGFIYKLRDDEDGPPEPTSGQTAPVPEGPDPVSDDEEE